MSIKIGDVFGELKVIELISSRGGKFRYNCKCSCGNTREFPRHALVRENNKSCGCLHTGISRTRQYLTWQNMKKRCDRPNNKSYKNYGGRGITYVDKWKTFAGFWEDMKDGYNDNLTLDRIDVDKDYSKDNCRWVDFNTQMNNMTTNHLVTYKGETLTMSQMARKHGITVDLLKGRIYAGWTVKDAIEKPVEQETIVYKGVTKTVSDWAKEKGMTYHQLKKRLMRGWTVERAIEQPLRKSPKRN